MQWISSLTSLTLICTIYCFSCEIEMQHRKDFTENKIKLQILKLIKILKYFTKINIKKNSKILQKFLQYWKTLVRAKLRRSGFLLGCRFVLRE